MIAQLYAMVQIDAIVQIDIDRDFTRKKSFDNPEFKSRTF